MKDWFAKDKERANKFTIKWDDFYVDFSKKIESLKTPYPIYWSWPKKLS